MFLIFIGVMSFIDKGFDKQWECDSLFFELGFTLYYVTIEVVILERWFLDSLYTLSYESRQHLTLIREI